MRKTKYLALTMLACATLLTGCGSKYNLTETQSDMVAEYAAQILLKYSPQYEEVTDSLEATTGGQEEDITTQAPASTVQQDTTSEEEPKENEQVEYVKDISDLFGFKDMGVTYNKYEFTTSYPKQSSQDVFTYVNASEDSKLLVVEFTITNKGNQKQTYDFLKKEVSYQLKYNDERGVAPMLTMLRDDMTTMKVTLAGKKKTKGVLVFEMSDKYAKNTKSLVLSATTDGVTKDISILP